MICPAGPSCCSTRVERRLADWSEEQYRESLLNRTNQMAADLDQKATQIDGKQLLSEGKHHQLFNCRLCLFSAQQGSERIPRHVHENLRSYLPKECSRLPELFQRSQSLLWQRQSKSCRFNFFILSFIEDLMEITFVLCLKFWAFRWCRLSNDMDIKE